MEDRNFNYIKDLTRYQRQETSTVQIGKVPIGSNYPVRIQSMTDTDSKDTEATVEHVITSYSIHYTKLYDDIFKTSTKSTFVINKSQKLSTKLGISLAITCIIEISV